jgi:hypothetical protein
LISEIIPGTTRYSSNNTSDHRQSFATALTNTSDRFTSAQQLINESSGSSALGIPSTHSRSNGSGSGSHESTTVIQNSLTPTAITAHSLSNPSRAEGANSGSVNGRAPPPPSSQINPNNPSQHSSGGIPTSSGAVPVGKSGVTAATRASFSASTATGGFSANGVAIIPTMATLAGTRRVANIVVVEVMDHVPEALLRAIMEVCMTIHSIFFWNLCDEI